MNRDEAIALLTGGEDGLREWNQWRSKDNTTPDLSGAKLYEADLRGAKLRRANLSGADLSDADLSGADLQDAVSLEPGDKWKEVLFKHIDDCDIFLLFWSQAAKESEWVKKEIQYATQRRESEPDRLPDIHPIVLPPPVDPPDELADLHFGDYLQDLIEQNENQNTTFPGECASDLKVSVESDTTEGT